MRELDTMESERYCVSSSELGEITASEGKWVEPKKLFSASRWVTEATINESEE